MHSGCSTLRIRFRVTGPAGADGDVAEYRAELRGHTRVLSALRETQLEHYGQHKAGAAEIKSGLAQMVRLLEGLSGPDSSGAC